MLAESSIEHIVEHEINFSIFSQDMDAPEHLMRMLSGMLLPACRESCGMPDPVVFQGTASATVCQLVMPTLTDDVCSFAQLVGFKESCPPR